MMRNMLAMAVLLLASACQQQAAPPLAQVDVQAAFDAFARLERAQISGINARNVTDAATRKPITAKGTNLSVWRKRSGGSWELVRDANADSPIG